MKIKIEEIEKNITLSKDLIEIGNAFENFSYQIEDFIHNLKKENKKNEAQN